MAASSSAGHHLYRRGVLCLSPSFLIRWLRRSRPLSTNRSSWQRIRRLGLSCKRALHAGNDRAAQPIDGRAGRSARMRAVVGPSGMSRTRSWLVSEPYGDDEPADELRAVDGHPEGCRVGVGHGVGLGEALGVGGDPGLGVGDGISPRMTETASTETGRPFHSPPRRPRAAQERRRHGKRPTLPARRPRTGSRAPADSIASMSGDLPRDGTARLHAPLPRLTIKGVVVSRLGLPGRPVGRARTRRARRASGPPDRSR